MNLKNANKDGIDYNIGLDIGTGSVGWAVTTAEGGELFHFKKKPTWGSRIFPSAQTAAEARQHRSQRRRYARRRWRLDLLQKLFEEEINKKDPEFFIRLRQSALFPEDRDSNHADYMNTLFNDSHFNERDYFKQFPTIYHLRNWLISTDEKADIRLIYLALHNIVKHRGNFLQEDKRFFTAENANVDNSVKGFCLELHEYCEQFQIPSCVIDNENEIIKTLKKTDLSKSQLRDEIGSLLGIQECEILPSSSAAKRMANAIANSLVGLKTDFGIIFFLNEDAPEDISVKIYLRNDEDVIQLEEVIPDEALSLFQAIKAVYSAYTLQGILSNPFGKPLPKNATLSSYKIEDYKRYHADLVLLKQLIKNYAPKKYDEFFRGAFYSPTSLHPQKYVYDKSKVHGYTKYNEVRNWPYDEFQNSVKKVLENTQALEDSAYKKMIERFEEGNFLQRLKTSENGAIPFQLHLEELDKIIENQGKHYPFLKKEKEKLDALVTFRIPYYIGPLTLKNARRQNDLKEGETRFAWSVRQPGKEDEKIYPWNWQEIIDKQSSAENFIYRMTGTCSYLLDAPVLPKNSLLYEEYCVLNELNGAQFSESGDSWRRFDFADRTDIINDLFRKKKVSYADVENWLKRERNHQFAHVRGGQGDKGFESKLSSYIFFAKDVFEVETIPESDYPMIEEIILWSTLFEDRSIFKDKLKKKYGNRLSDKQIKKIVQKRFSGWGRLSKELLSGLKANTDNGPVSIIDVLREGNPNSNHPSRPMVFMEIIADKSLGFNQRIDEYNEKRLSSSQGLVLDDLPGSPALRRSVNQALRIVEEIVHIAKRKPKNIFIEVTRSDDMRAKGKRTKSRYDALSNATAALKEEASELWNQDIAKELSSNKKSEFNEKLTLYFMQHGKSLYSGRPLDIDELSKYEVDHIIPQSFVKDDSLENKALVFKEENQRKSDQLLIDSDIRRKMREYWKALYGAKLIGEKKYRNLMRSQISEKQAEGFIARQLVETSQIVKIVQSFLKQKYQDTGVWPIKATLSAELRNLKSEKDNLPLFPKCREVNDFHHAQDALLASEIGRFILKRHSDLFFHPIGTARIAKQYVKRESAKLQRKGVAPVNGSFLVKSFNSSGFDKETGEIFEDDWSAESEIEKLEKYFNYRQCYISRMPEETSGAFWDQNILSPRKKKNLSLSIKKDLNPKKYGGYNSEKVAYFFVYKAFNEKEEEAIRLSPIPVSKAASIKKNPEMLTKYAEQLAKEENLVFSEIIRPKILKYQLIAYDHAYFYIYGEDDLLNGVQVALDLKYMRNMYQLLKNQDISKEEIMVLYDQIAESLEKYSPKLAEILKIPERREAFSEASFEIEKKVIFEFLAIARAGKDRIDLSGLKDSSNEPGPKKAGHVSISYRNVFDKENGLDLIDQSITGMLEKRTHFGI